MQSSLPNKKMAASVTLRPLYYPKAIQEQQTQTQTNTVHVAMQGLCGVVSYGASRARWIVTDAQGRPGVY